jgi:hypothetical protein
MESDKDAIAAGAKVLADVNPKSPQSEKQISYEYKRIG